MPPVITSPGCWRPTGFPGQAITDSRQRRNSVVQVLAQLPALWVWDNVEPVTGFPAETPSAWTPRAG